MNVQETNHRKGDSIEATWISLWSFQIKEKSNEKIETWNLVVLLCNMHMQVQEAFSEPNSS